ITSDDCDRPRRSVRDEKACTDGAECVNRTDREVEATAAEYEGCRARDAAESEGDGPRDDEVQRRRPQQFDQVAVGREVAVLEREEDTEREDAPGKPGLLGVPVEVAPVGGPPISEGVPRRGVDGRAREERRSHHASVSTGWSDNAP